jgi:hypothetical protein
MPNREASALSGSVPVGPSCIEDLRWGIFFFGNELFTNKKKAF